MNEKLGPRFKIEKRRISAEGKETKEFAEFTPEKVIYVEIDDEITHVFDRVKRVRQKKIALAVPKRALLLESIVNLKILKKKLDELEKEIVMVTSDALGLQMAEKVGIPAFERLFEKEAALPEGPKQPTRLTEKPMKMAGEKVSLSEVIRQERPNFWSGVIARIKDRIRKKRDARSSSHKTRIVFLAPNKQALFTLVLVTVLLLLAIAYIALPGATIYMTPRSSVLDPTHNTTFLDFEKNRDILENPPGNSILIATYPVKPPPFEKKFTHPATGKLFQGKNATGTITIINLSNAPWDLAERTRFQTDEGLVFRIPRAVRVPAARPEIPGMLDVTVSADEFDASGQIIGSRGNIPASRFFLPGIKNPENQKKLYGESNNSFSGGLTQITKIVSEEDIKAAAEAAKREASKSAADDLKKYLEEQNLVNRTNLSLLAERHLVKIIGEPEIIVPADIVGKTVEQFEATVRYTARGIAFDRQTLITALKERLLTRVDPDKKILKVEEDDVSYKFLEEDEAAGRVRLTATMRAIQTYELDPEKENGHRFLKKISDHIVGLKVRDAVAYLQQQTNEIERVEIKTWPIWAPTIPNIADNIKFVIREEE